MKCSLDKRNMFIFMSLIMLLGPFCIVDFAHSASVCTYNHLFLIYPSTDVDYIKNGQSQHYTGTMSDQLKTTVINAFKNLPNLIVDGSAGLVSSKYYIIEMGHPITKI
jgi:hypothetical protein